MVQEGSADISVEQTIRNVVDNVTASSGPAMVCSNGVCLPRGTTLADLDLAKQNLILTAKRVVEAQSGGATSTINLPRAKELVAPTYFLNSDPFKIADLVGKKVILIDFWTYDCVNCQHVIPYLNDWYAKYKDKGLQIIGVHSPEFEFEKDQQNVENAVAKFGIKYPVVMDNQFGTWNAYQNKFWPRMYLIDLNGNIVGDHIGEGNYDQIEGEIKKLLGV